MNTKDLSVDELKYNIEFLRNHMIATGLSKGLTHPDTIKISRELDVLLSIHRKMNSK